MEERIIKLLQQALNPSFLEVKNNSHLHRGHLGDNGTNETHFKITIKADELSKMSKIQAHRKINQIIADEFKKGLHALEIEVR